MGNTEGNSENLNQSFKSVQQLSQQYGSTVHPWLADAIIMVDPQGQTVIQTRKRVTNEMDFSQWLIEKGNITHGHKKYLFLPSIMSEVQNDYCGQRLTAVMTYDFYPFCLDKQIELRRQMHRLFDELEIWYLIYTGLVAICYFEKVGLKMGNISPANVLLNSKGHIRYVNRFSWPNEYPVTDNRLVYFAPQQIDRHNFDPSKADTFGFGLMVIQTLLMKDISFLYTANTGFDFSGLQALKNELLSTKIYSRLIIEVVMEMTDANPVSRPRASTVLSWIRPYQKDILHFRKFFK